MKAIDRHYYIRFLAVGNTELKSRKDLSDEERYKKAIEETRERYLQDLENSVLSGNMAQAQHIIKEFAEYEKELAERGDKYGQITND